MYLSESIKWGIVSKVNAEKATARVTFPDRDGMVSYDLPVLQHNTGFAKCYSLPIVGQPVLCAFLGTGIEDGFIVGSMYNAENKPPKTGNVHYVYFDDGALIEYDAESQIMKLKSGGGGVIIDDNLIVKGTAKIEQLLTAEASATIKDTLTVQGNAAVTGSATITGTVTGGGVSLSTHTHGGVQPGSGTTGGPS